MACLLSINAAANGEVHVLNKGIGGHNTRNALQRFDRDVVALRPDHLVIYFGINDALNSAKLVPVDAFRENMQEMIDRARNIGVKTIILTTPNPIVAHYVKQRHPKHPQQDLNTHLDAYDVTVRDLAEQNQLPLADLHNVLLEHCPDLESPKSLIRNLANSQSRDGVHLTPPGYRIMAELIASLLIDRVEADDLVVCFGDSITFGAHVKGAGTTSGETYPAWLGRLLNKDSGQTAADALPPPPDDSKADDSKAAHP